VQRVVLDDGRTLDCDLAVACVGAAASKDVLRGTPISAEKAILVDEHCRTNVPGVFAAGDCCAVLDPRFGKHRWFDHWDHAVVTGTLAGRNMAGTGADESYDAVSPFSTEVFGLTTTVWGEARLVDRRLVRGTPKVEAPGFVEIGVAADGRVAQVVAVGHQGEDELLRELVARRFEVDGNQEAVKDPAVPLRELLG
jgi:NADPH-dependent 2,4-dienoyl-CoA reductase/sulfur reductase-like enzyme